MKIRKQQREKQREQKNRKKSSGRALESTLTWLRGGNLMKETTSLANQNNDMGTNYIKGRMKLQM